MPQIYGYALAGKERCGAARSGYTSTRLFLAVNGVQVATARAGVANVLLDSLVVTEVLNQIPNTAAFTMQGSEPAEGQDVVITIGSINNGDRLFAGTLLNRSHDYFEKPANWQAPVNVVDYTWHLTRRRFSGLFTNVAPAVVAAAIVAVVPGFTVTVAAGLPTLDTISFTDVDCLAALTQLANRCGGYCDVDYQKVVKVFLTDASVTNPTDLTAAHASLSALAFTRDLSQVRTRVFVEGGGVTALAPCAVGETILPVSTTAWYNAVGGKLKTGQQHLTYTGIAVGGDGSIVGPGVTPSAAPNVATIAGAGVEAGLHKYAYTWVTAAGETLPSPLASVTPGTVLVTAPPAIGFIAGAASGTGLLTHDSWYGYVVTFTNASGETTVSPVYVQYLNYTAFLSDSMSLSAIPTSADPSVTGRKVYRTTAQASSGAAASATRFLCNTIAENASTTFIDQLADGSLGAAAPSSNTATVVKQQVTIAGVGVGPSGTTSRKVYRTAAAGAQLKLQQTIANNTATTGITDATADASLGANAPASDTSGLTQPAGQVSPGSTTLIVAGTAFAAAAGGWAIIGNGTQVIRYTGFSNGSLTGIPASGPGAIVAAVSYNSTITAAPSLIGIPASGTGAIVYPILQGDPINLLVQVDDTAAQTALGLLIGGGDDGVVEDFLQDRTIGETEALARGRAQLALSRVLVSLTYKTRDRNTHAGRTIHVNLGSPTNLTGDFQIQHVTIDTFQTALLPTYTVQASSNRFSLEDLLRLARAA